MVFELQPRLENALVRLEPLRDDDFEALYAVASDPLIWEQHPNKDRYRRDVFQVYFEGALESKGASRVLDANGALIGSSRYYDLDEAQRVAAIGYTFLARRTWGLGYNTALKQLMLDHAFRFVDRVLFHVGENNFRSRKAMEKLGAIYQGLISMSYHGEPARQNVVYSIDSRDWAGRAPRPPAHRRVTPP